MKVHIYPTIDPHAPDPGNGGIHRVVLAQYQKLPALGWEVVPTAAEADVIHCHVELPPTYARLHADKPIVLSSHGFYWTDGGYDWQDWCYQTNQKHMAALRSADAIVAVSDWVAQSIRRNTMRPVAVVRNGIDPAEWEPVPVEQRGRYVLWNKTRVDPICDTAPMNDVAALLPDVQFVSTFGIDAPNIEMTGRLPHAEARELVRRAGVYLATSRETWGIGTLEAMAAGVPVVGYAFGGQVEFVEHQVDGWLAQPGDVAGLAQGIRWALENREAVGRRAREKAMAYTLEAAAEGYAAVYERALYHRNLRATGPKVSVIVPAYNMGDYLEDALASVAAQTIDDWECVIVNDASPDERDQEIAVRYMAADNRFRYQRLEQNGYLAHARNSGIGIAHGRYIMPLDADDRLEPNALAVLSAALDGTREIDIAYGGVVFTEPDGQTLKRYPDAERRGYGPGHSGWPVSFSLDRMLNGPGQLLPYASMYRREVWEYTGGYRERCRSSEDQDFWLRATSYGFNARMVTTADTLAYRVRPDSMSSAGWEEHRGWYPWVADRQLLPGGAIQDGKESRYLPMPAYSPAPIAVVIPVGPGHAPLVYDAIDSVDAQTFRNWECLVINDTGRPLPMLPSWVRVVEQTGYAQYGGAAAARNAGIAASRAPLYLPLDADDYLQPRALEEMLAAYMDSPEPTVIYSDFWEDPDGVLKVFETPDYDPWALIQRGALHAVTALTPRRFWAEVGGYNETVAWEDWAFALALAGRGHCSRRVAAPLLTYRKGTGQRREQNMAAFEESKRTIMQMDFGAEPGGALLACSRCGSGRGTTARAFSVPQVRQMLPPSEDYVMMHYSGNKAGDVAFSSRVDRRVTYRFSTQRQEGYVHKQDAEWMNQYDDFEIVAQPSVQATQEGAAAPLVAARVPSAVAVAEPPQGGYDGAWQPGSGIILQGGATAVAEPPVAPVSEPQPFAVPEDATIAAAPVEERPAPEYSEEVRRMARDTTREKLIADATELGVEGADTLPNKEQIANAIVQFRRMFGG